MYKDIEIRGLNSGSHSYCCQSSFVLQPPIPHAFQAVSLSPHVGNGTHRMVNYSIWCSLVLQLAYRRILSRITYTCNSGLVNGYLRKRKNITILSLTSPVLHKKWLCQMLNARRHKDTDIKKNPVYYEYCTCGLLLCRCLILNVIVLRTWLCS